MPRAPKFVHPLRAVREAVNKSQPEFAKMFGVSGSFIQAIELGQRNLSDELADAIMLRLGVDAESLKRKRGLPVSLIGLNKAEFLLQSERSDDLEKVYPFVMRHEDYKALEKVRDQGERFRRSVVFWQETIVPAWKSEHWQVRDALENKLRLLFEAAERENKYHAVAMRLSRWIEDAVNEFRLRTTIDVIRKPLSGRDAQWPTFMETLSESFTLLPLSKKHRKIRQTITGKITHKNCERVICHIGTENGMILGKRLGDLPDNVIKWLVKNWAPKLTSSAGEEDRRLRGALKLVWRKRRKP
jgi:transcriptional regulator with XRE-family HTH domain